MNLHRTHATNGRAEGLVFFGAALGVFVVGSAAGYMAGLLSAPASGRETRRRLGHRLDEEKQALVRRGQRTVDGAVDRMHRGIESGRRKLNRRFAA
jgi:gas vesicle protein